MESQCVIYEDQDDYIDDVEEQIRDGIRRYTLYSKMFAEPEHWKMAKDEIKRFFHYELESCFSKTAVKRDIDGIIRMRLEEKD